MKDERLAIENEAFASKLLSSSHFFAALPRKMIRKREFCGGFVSLGKGREWVVREMVVFM